jgi:excisionase family DNA binding protein
MTQLYTITEAASIARVSYTTVRRWIRDGKLPVVRDPSGRPMVRAEDLLREEKGGQDDPA